jgi:hypothetical protein
MIRGLIKASALLFFGWFALAGRAEENKAARQVYQRYQNAVVHISAVAKLPMGGGGEKVKVTALGTVVDPSGLVVFSTAQLDLVALIKNLVSNQISESLPPIQFELSDVTIRFPEGGETTAKIVLKDDDLGLGFVAPGKPLDPARKGKLTALPLTDSVKPDVLDNVILITRLGKMLNYQAAVHTSTIAAIITKPRTLYVVGSPGCPVFTVDGKLVGIAVLSPGGPSGGIFGVIAGAGGSAAVTVPTSEVRRLADQAREQLGSGEK